MINQEAESDQNVYLTISTTRSKDVLKISKKGSVVLHGTKVFTDENLSKAITYFYVELEKLIGLSESLQLENVNLDFLDKVKYEPFDDLTKSLLIEFLSDLLDLHVQGVVNLKPN